MNQTQNQQTTAKKSHGGPPQIDAGSRNYVPYTMIYVDAAGTQSTGYLISTSSTSYRSSDNGHAYTIDAASEYYNVSTLLAALASAVTGTTLTFQTGGSQAYPQSGGPIANFAGVYAGETSQPVASLTWAQWTGAPSSAFSDGAVMAVAFTNLSFANGAYSGWIDWWFLGQRSPADSLISSTSNTQLTYGTAPAASGGNVWWHAQASLTTKHLW